VPNKTVCYYAGCTKISIGGYVPVVKVEYDDNVVSKSDADAVCEAIRQIVQDITHISTVYVYGNTAQIKVNPAPVKIWIEMSAHKIKNPEDLAQRVRDALTAWKASAGFDHLINLMLVPMEWQLERDI